jgi:hypothetical protein
MVWDLHASEAVEMAKSKFDNISVLSVNSKEANPGRRRGFTIMILRENGTF